MKNRRFVIRRSKNGQKRVQNLKKLLLCFFGTPCIMIYDVWYIDMYYQDYHPRQTHQHYHTNHRHHWYQLSLMCRNNSWSWTPVSDLSVSVRRTHSIWSHFHFNRRIRNVIANFHCECKSKTNNFSRNVSFKLLFPTSWQKYFFITAVFKTQIQQERFWHLIRNNTISNIQDLGIKKTITRIWNEL